VVGLEQIGTPRCTTSTPWLPNQLPSTTCSEQHDYKNKYFFYSLETMQETGSLCTSKLEDFYQDEQGATFDIKLFDTPSWPRGEWSLTLFGEKFTYKSDGKTAGGLWQAARKIDCDGDLGHHGEHNLDVTCCSKYMLTVERP
jgi:hypothetical protein